jgi:hypothetical protein
VRNGLGHRISSCGGFADTDSLRGQNSSAKSLTVPLRGSHTGHGELACDVAQMHHAGGVAVTIDEVGLATLGWVQ